MSYDRLFKVVVIGNSGVGKTSIINKFTDNTDPTEAYNTTVGVEFKVKTLSINDEQVKLQIWDTTGQERYRGLTTAYYRGANGILLVYDVTTGQSFEDLDRWIKIISQYADPHTPIIILGHKSDSNTDIKVDYYADNIPIILTSVKTPKSIDESFYSLINRMIHESAKTSQPATHKRKSRRCTII